MTAKTAIRKQRAVVLLSGALSLACLTAAHACELQIIWKAALAPSAKSSQAGTPSATGTAAIDFDLVHPSATVQVETKNVQDVRAIEMHVARSYTDHTGPTVLTVYTSADGPLPPRLTRHVTEADLHTQTAPKIAAFADVVNAVVNDKAYVVITTKAHPDGELFGIIHMHKEEIYSDNPADAAHDAALHHAAQAHTSTPSPTP
jgi:hypothetical protein